MHIERHEIEGEDFFVPSVLLTPENPSGAAVVVHGYGGCKEEVLGLAWRIAEKGIAACTIDLRGHGEHRLPLDALLLRDVDCAVRYCRTFGKVAAVGHSLGGRLALFSEADCAVAISPALKEVYSTKTRESMKALRGHRVRQAREDLPFDILVASPPWQPAQDKPVTIIYGSRDLSDIIEVCREFKEKGLEVIEIKRALHSDIYLLEETFDLVAEALKRGLQ